MVGEKVRREKELGFSGCNSRRGTGSLHPVAIETIAGGDEAVGAIFDLYPDLLLTFDPSWDDPRAPPQRSAGGALTICFSLLKQGALS